MSGKDLEFGQCAALGIDLAQEALKIFLASDKAVGLVVTEFNTSLDKDCSLAERLAILIREAKRR